MSDTANTDELDYDLEAVGYPEDEPEAVTSQLMGLLGAIAHRRRRVATRPEPDARHPDIGRYRELRTAVECLIDCAGYPAPDHREKLLDLVALALDAVVAADNAAAPPAAA